MQRSDVRYRISERRATWRIPRELPTTKVMLRRLRMDGDFTDDEILKAIAPLCAAHGLTVDEVLYLKIRHWQTVFTREALAEVA